MKVRRRRRKGAEVIVVEDLNLSWATRFLRPFSLALSQSAHYPATVVAYYESSCCTVHDTTKMTEFKFRKKNDSFLSHCCFFS